MENSKAKFICLPFKLNPAIKNSVAKHKYQKPIISFEEHYKEKTMIQKIKLNLIISFFRLKPAIKKLDPGNYEEIMEAFKKHYNEISERTKKESGIMAFHRMFMIIGLALYKGLNNRIQDKKELIDKIRYPMARTYSPKHSLYSVFYP